MLNGAPYDISVPADWNGGLVMYAHGYQVQPRPAGAEENEAQRALRLAFTERGFAFAKSQYSKQGWAVKEGIEDTEALRKHFVRTFGQPDSTFVTGHSMGGVITIATIEYVRQYYTPTGRVTDPVLALHTTYDQLVNARHVGFYDTLVALAGTQDLFALNYVKADGHCNISADITGRGFDALRRWVAEGVRPPPGEIR